MTAVHLDGVLSAGQLRSTADHLASLQQDDGLIPWFTGHHGDPWDHVEGAMALTVMGRIDQARLAFAWSAENQSSDGSWPMETFEGEVREPSVDTNQCTYLAAGVWHHWLVTGDRPFVHRMWPTVRAAMDFAVDLQSPDGTVPWSRDGAGQVSDHALLTGSACMVLSLRCALALAELVGDPQPDWELAAARLAHAVAVHPEAFADKSTFAMDWYYPVLGGALTGDPARAHLQARWDQFVVAGRGCRCVSDRPWVTAAETAELAMALDAVGRTQAAVQLLRDVQFLRTDTGGYWTGWVFPEEVVWPREQSSWTSAAMILAADTLSRTTPGHGLFRGAGLPALLELRDCHHDCVVPARRAR